MEKIEKVSFQSEGKRISGILHLPEKKKPPCVIASHGLLSSKESEKYISLAERLSTEEIAMLRFDFRGCGESEGSEGDQTVSGKMADLSSAIDFIRSYPGLGRRMGLVGSSLGGYVSLIIASADQKIRATVVWSTPFHLDDLRSNRGTEGYPLPGDAFFEYLPKHRLLSLLPKIANGLVIHGGKDELVPVDHAWEIFRGLGGPKEIHLIEGADHRLTEPAHRQRAMDVTVEWFKRYL